MISKLLDYVVREENSVRHLKSHQLEEKQREAIEVSAAAIRKSWEEMYEKHDFRFINLFEEQEKEHDDILRDGISGTDS